MFLRKSLLGVIGIILALGMVAFAQEPQPQNPPSPEGALRGERMERRREKHRERLGREGMRRHKGRDGIGRRGPGMGHFGRELNLSDAQKEQSRAIMQRRLESTKVQREELFRLREKRSAGTFTAEDEARAKALHQEIRASMEGARTEMAGVLTAEQKAKLEEAKAERKAKHEQRKKERGERMKERQELRNKPQ
ncbi:MAG: Spy/CpxP family protein refolding chaperone [Pyrinomonadaceae bacterium]|nr:Spy/CpxP family protein refolding chaperone [Pyrinomonadaceae bacterium]